MPSLSSLRSHLSQFLEVTSAAEVVLFERTTFLVISSVTAPKPGSTGKIEDAKKGPEEQKEVEGDDEWDKRRFERISTMVKAFKLGCSYVVVHSFRVHIVSWARCRVARRRRAILTTPRSPPGKFELRSCRSPCVRPTTPPSSTLSPPRLISSLSLVEMFVSRIFTLTLSRRSLVVIPVVMSRTRRILGSTDLGNLCSTRPD